MVIDGYIINIPKLFAQQNNSFDPISIPSTLGTTIGAPIKNGFSNINPVINNFGSNYGVCNPINKTNSLPTITSSESLMHSPTLTIGPQSLVRTVTVGPELFKFVYSYWTNPSTSNNLATLTGQQGPRFVETDVNSGPSFLAVVLHYLGTQTLSGVSAAIKLPPGFETTYPLTGHPNRYNLAFSLFQSTINPGQTIVLVFPVTILKNVNVQTPYINSIALHYLRSDMESLTYQIDNHIMDTFMSSFMIKNNLPSPPAATGSTSTNTCGGTDTFSKDIMQKNIFNKYYDFVNQFVPIIFTITGQEVLNVNIAKVNATAVQLNAAQINLPGNANKFNPNSTETAINVRPTALKVYVNNSGDAPVYNLRAQFAQGTGNNPTVGLNQLGFISGQPAGIGSSNTPTSPPAVLLDKTSFLIGYLPPHSSRSVNITAIANSIAYGTIATFNVGLTYTDVTGTLNPSQSYSIGVLLSTSSYCVQESKCSTSLTTPANNTVILGAINNVSPPINNVSPPISLIPTIISKQLLQQ
jgi:hypothetical protein